MINTGITSRYTATKLYALDTNMVSTFATAKEFQKSGSLFISKHKNWQVMRI